MESKEKRTSSPYDNLLERRKETDNRNKKTNIQKINQISIYICNLKQILVYMNQNAADKLNGKPEDFVGKSLLEVFPDSYENIKERHEQVLSTENEMVFEEIVDLPLGRKWIWSNILLLRDVNGEITEIQTVEHDILWRRRAEEELKKYHKQLEELVEERTAELTKLNKKLTEDMIKIKNAEEKNWFQQEQLIQADKMTSLGILVSGVAHEINNPNGILMLNIPILQKIWGSVFPILDEHYKNNGDFTVANQNYSVIKHTVSSLLSSMINASRRIKNIVNGLKNYSRKEPSDLTQNININVIVNTAIALMSNLIKKSTNNFSTHLERNLPTIIGNSQRLEQVIINLIENSCQALKNKKCKISISTKYCPDDKKITVSVKDEGIGIEAENLKKLTDPFYTTKRSYGGTGLGLSISSKIVRDHNGILTFESTKGKGTIATLIFHKGE